MSKIRLGIIRCDLHAIYYANVMQTFDPDVLIEPEQGSGGHFYFHQSYHDPREMTIPQVEGFELVKVWDENRANAERMVKIYDSRPTICDSYEQVSDDVDLVLIANCNDFGDDHLKFASPGIAKGVPHFIDKPFAYEVGEARKLVALANEHDVPIMSLSILRALPHVARFRDRFAELGAPAFGLIKGGLYTMNGRVHTISLAQHLFGDGVAAVESMGGDERPYIGRLDYGGRGDRPEAGVVLNCDVGPTYHCAFYASAYSGEGAIHSDRLSDFEFPWGVVEIVRKIKRMVETRKGQASYEQMVENIAVATALRLSLAEHRLVKLSEV